MCSPVHRHLSQHQDQSSVSASGHRGHTKVCLSCEPYCNTHAHPHAHTYTCTHVQKAITNNNTSGLENTKDCPKGASSLGGDGDVQFQRQMVGFQKGKVKRETVKRCYYNIFITVYHVGHCSGLYLLHIKHVVEVHLQHHYEEQNVIQH